MSLSGTQFSGIFMAQESDEFETFYKGPINAVAIVRS